MAKFFATVVYVIDAENEESAREQADQMAASPDCPEFVESAWVDNVEAVEDDDEPGEAWGTGLDDEGEDD